MERSHGGGVEGKCRKDNGHDLQSGLDLLQSSDELPCAVWQQQHLLQWLQTLGTLEMQWAIRTDTKS